MFQAGKRAALALSIAAILAPVAQAMPYDQPGENGSAAVTRADDRAGIRGVGDTAPQLDPAYLRALELRGQALNELYGGSTAARPDNRSGLRGPGTQPVEGPQATHVAIRPDDRVGLRGVEPITVGVSEPSGFDWGDAGIGALSAFGIALVAGAMLFTVYTRQSRHDRVAVL